MNWRYGIGLLFILSGCKDATFIGELQEKEHQQALMLEPLLLPTALAPHSYQAQGYSSPFTPLFEEAFFAPPAPDPTVTSSASIVCSLPTTLAPMVLADYPLEELSLRGTLTNGHQRSALIYHPQGGVYLASVGQGVSQQPAEITGIQANSVQLTEYRGDGQGCWQTNTTQLALWTSPN